MATKSGLRGVQQVVANLNAVGEVTPADRRAARAAALEPTVAAVKQHLISNDSVDTGALIASLGIAPAQGKSNRTEVGAREGIFKKQRPSVRYHLVEYPVAPHWQPNRFGGIMHPGHPGYPSLRPGFEETKDQAVKIYLLEISRAIIAKAAALARSRK